MNISAKDFQRFFRYFFYASLAIIALQYVKWFLIDPFLPQGGHSSSSNFKLSVFLLIIYAVFFFLSQFVRNFIAYLIVALMLLVILNYLNERMPYFDTVFQCQGATYYVANIHYDIYWDTELTKWLGGLNYETHGMPSQRIFNIACDEHEAEINFVGHDNQLFYSKGEVSRTFYPETAQFKEHRYFLEEGWSCDNGCSISSYRLYQCRLDFTSCNPLPISYALSSKRDDDAIYELKPDEIANTISLFQWFSDNEDEVLIFSFGNEMHCYAEGCKINGK